MPAGSACAPRDRHVDGSRTRARNTGRAFGEFYDGKDTATRFALLPRVSQDETKDMDGAQHGAKGVEVVRTVIVEYAETDNKNISCFIVDRLRIASEWI